MDLWAAIACGNLSLRRLSVLLAHLPEDSEVRVAIHGRHARWTLTDDLLASVVTLLARANWQRAGGQYALPEPVTRPPSKLEIEQEEQRKTGLLARLKEARARAAAMRKRA